MRNRLRTEHLINISLIALSVCLVVFTRNNPFYWDNTAQTSVPANWYYETNFRYFYVPDEIATGHPTFVGMYFALLWKIFGRSLIVCHFGMLPFVFGLLYQIHRFLRNLDIDSNRAILVIMAFIIADTTFLSQLSLITFDVIQLFFFFLCINLVLKGKNILLSFCYTAFILVSLRASIMAGGLLLFNVLYDRYQQGCSFQLKNYLKYLPGILALVLFLVMFRIEKGWVIHNTVSNEWAGSGEWASPRRMLVNIVVFAWQVLDFGRIGLFIVLLAFILKTLKHRKFEDSTLRILFLIMLSQCLLFFPVLVTSQISFGHRYFLPVIIPSIIIVTYWILHYSRIKYLWLASTFILLLAGHFLIYPRGISQGWDSTTMHWNYLKAAESMHSYIKEKGIDKSEIWTFFPNNRSRYYTHLENDKADIYGGMAFESKYVLYSNAFNVSPIVLDSLFNMNSRWIEVKDISCNRIHMILYQKTEP